MTKSDHRGISIYCSTCHKQKKPIGRDTANVGLCLSNVGLCLSDCDGYYEDPPVGNLWPGELGSEYGYAYSRNGTEVV